MKLKEYVEIKYPDALNAIRHSESAKDVTELTDYEKAIIYKYTDDGYVVNETLRDSKGVKVPEFAHHLNTVLAKLPPLSDGEVVVYRGIFKTNFVLNQYKKALNEKTILTEYGFLSTTQSKKVASQFGQVLLIIFSKNGKPIGNLSKFGTHSATNEQEILFQSGTQFNVLDIEEDANNAVIILKEL